MGENPVNGHTERELAHVHVPLTVYIGDYGYLKAEAIVTGNGVEAHVNGELSELLYRMVTAGVIQNVAVTFNTPPAVPVYRDGDIRWVKPYTEGENHGR